MSKRSVYLSEKAEGIISLLSDEAFHGSKNYSGSINAGLVLLEELMQKSKPELSENEWAILYNTYAGCAVEINLPIRLAADVMDNLGVYDITKMDQETAGLIGKLSTMSQCEQAAILWQVKAFWGEDNGQAGL